ncbi:MAG: tyrosine-type recombinase/integrase [Acidobacteria bacterium]|nr:tyrosine-type recombinase/integrase [Acidobacteriota bacterium]
MEFAVDVLRGHPYSCEEDRSVAPGVRREEFSAFATRLAARGADLLTIEELLGHSNITMPMRYAHQDNPRKVVQLLAGDGRHMGTNTKHAATRKCSSNTKDNRSHPSSIGRAPHS